MDNHSPETAILAWLQEKIDEMTDEELAKFRGDLLFNQLLDIYELIAKLEKRDRAGKLQNTKIFSMTQVRVRKFPQGDIILLFPEIAISPDLIFSWTLTSEHGSASPALIHKLPLATKREKEQTIDAYENLYCCKVQDLERDRAKEIS